MIKLKNILLENEPWLEPVYQFGQEETIDSLPEGFEDCFTSDNKLKSFDSLSKKCMSKFYDYLMSQGSWKRKLAGPFYKVGPDLFTDTTGVFSKFNDDSAITDSTIVAYDLTKLDKKQTKLINVIKTAYGERSSAWARGSEDDGGFELVDSDGGGFTKKGPGGGGGGEDNEWAWWEKIVYPLGILYGGVIFVNFIKGLGKGGWLRAAEREGKSLRWYIKTALPGSATGIEIIRKAVTKIQKRNQNKKVNGLMEFLEDMGNPNGLVYNEMRAAMKKKGGTSAMEREAVINKLAKGWKSARLIEKEYARLLEVLIEGFKYGRYSMDFMRRMLPRDTYLELRPTLLKYYNNNQKKFQDVIAQNDSDTTPDTDIDQMT